LKDPTEKMNQVSPDISFMHLPEYSFDSMRNWRLPAGVPFRAFINHISKTLFQMPDGSLMKVDTSNFSWNAGVMMLHLSHKKFIPEVYTITEECYPHTNNHAVEQYAFSIVLQNHTTVYRCDDVSYHYWYRIKKRLTDPFLQREVAKFHTISISSCFDHIRKTTRDLPKYIENHSLYLKDVSIQSFNEDDFLKGYKYAIRAWLKDPSDGAFIRDVLYHTKRFILFKR
jgi:hypothetical protein